jgi:hypothetical protein
MDFNVDKLPVAKLAESIEKIKLRKYQEAFNNGEVINESLKERIRKESREEVGIFDDKSSLELFRDISQEVYQTFKDWLDWNEDIYTVVTLWVMGSLIHDTFETYPILFFNATKGAGKTRALKLISFLGDGILTSSPTESVLYRYPKHKLLCLDECESIGNKDKMALREILNSSYKAGLTVLRNKKIKTSEGEGYEMEGFEPYKPIVIANIWGMEDVLGDRSVKVIIDKSNNPLYSKKIENFQTNKFLLNLKSKISSLKFALSQNDVDNDVDEAKKEYADRWNCYISSHLSTSSSSSSSLLLSTSSSFNEEMLFERLLKSNMDGRNLELFFPLIRVAEMISDVWLARILRIAESYVVEKKSDEIASSRDVMLLDFISRKIWSEKEFISLKEMALDFKNFIGEEEEDDRFVNPRSILRSLSRLKLVIEKKRFTKGVEARIDCEKARIKIRMYKEEK